MLGSAVSFFWCVWFLAGMIAYLFLYRTVESLYWNYRSQRGDEPDRGEFQRLHMVILTVWFMLSLIGMMLSNALFPLI